MFRRKYGEAIENLLEMELMENVVAILYLKYSGVIVRTLNQVFAFDLADMLSKSDIEALTRLDAYLITHGHYDHYSREHTKLIHNRTNAYVIAEPSVAADLRGAIPSEKLISARPGETFDLKEFKVTSIEGLHRGPIVLYLVEGKDLTIFHGGDSAYVPLENYKADLALVPTGSPSPTASPRDAFKMVSALKVKAAASFHGTTSQHNEFINLVKNNIPSIDVYALREGEILKVSIK